VKTFYVVRVPWGNNTEHGTRTTQCGTKMRSFATWEEVPLFDSEEGEANFWAENRPDLRLMEAALAGNTGDSAESVTITLRIDPRMLARIKRLARSRYLNYQSMIKQWLSERMEQELRER
jgi:CopG antitoxin of type II toxin-antitoxin system